ncbi:hypothetical protein P691DRAFT_763060 [Macrolepiota fuliginosa MF-IS2]|uniref:Uncharacterized protein n=1 Tax=Macrolepiota fuliginosa MF-IS2 TaxID=1400762 RepID=A0A9P6BY74_9AGAR|nr:hypothetical protein P691DRAFT_763060 [Macrolepiota fuliginosa MF-IS2]
MDPSPSLPNQLSQPLVYLLGVGMQWTRYPDPICWVKDQAYVFHAENKTFHFSITWLSCHLGVVEDLVKACTDSMKGTNADPIFVEGVSTDKMALFIRWLSNA